LYQNKLKIAVALQQVDLTQHQAGIAMLRVALQYVLEFDDRGGVVAAVAV